MRFDLALFNALHRFWGANRFLDAMGLFFANILTYLLALGMLVFIFRFAHSNRERLFVAAEMLLAYLFSRWLITGTIAALVKRARPFAALGFQPPFVPLTSGSFPSGHMSGLFSIAFVIFSLDFRWGLVYFALSLLVGIGRVFVGVHWPSDVIAGILIGIGSGFVIHLLASPSRRELFSAADADSVDPGPGSNSTPGPGPQAGPGAA